MTLQVMLSIMLNMSKLNILMDLSNMRLSIDIPPEWVKQIKQAALNADAQSVSDYIRILIAKDIGLEQLNKPWGGNRQVEQDEQVHQDTQVEQSAAIEPDEREAHVDLPKTTKNVLSPVSNGDKSPDEVIRERRALAAVKFTPPKGKK